MKNIIFVSLIALMAFGYGCTPEDQKPDDEGAIACTLEVKICPDGSYVGRKPPTCEFEQCPSDDWENAEGSDLSFKYPKDFGSEFVDPQNWPPEVKISEGIFSCIGDVVEVNNHSYCVTEEREGAAGSTYVSYEYLRNLVQEDSKLQITFTLRFPQCANYDEEQKSACQKDQSELDLDKFVDRIAESVVIK